MSYAKKCQKRNQEFFEEYEKKQKHLEKEKEKQKEQQLKHLESNPGFVRRGSVHDLLHGKGNFFEQLVTEDKNKEKEREKKEKLKTLAKKENNVKK